MGLEDQSAKSFMVNKVSACGGGVDNSWRSMEVVLRVLVAVIAGTAAIVMAKDKQENVFEVANCGFRSIHRCSRIRVNKLSITHSLKFGFPWMLKVLNRCFNYTSKSH